MSSKRKKCPCEICRFRRYAEDDPHSLLGVFWTWHTKWCPGWKRHLNILQEYGESPPSVGSLRGLWDEKDRQ